MKSKEQIKKHLERREFISNETDKDKAYISALKWVLE